MEGSLVPKSSWVRRQLSALASQPFWCGRSHPGEGAETQHSFRPFCHRAKLRFSPAAVAAHFWGRGTNILAGEMDGAKEEAAGSREEGRTNSRLALSGPLFGGGGGVGRNEDWAVQDWGALCRAPSAHEKKGRGGGGLGHWGSGRLGRAKKGGRGIPLGLPKTYWLVLAGRPHTHAHRKGSFWCAASEGKKRGMRELAELAKRRPAGAENLLDGPLLVLSSSSKLNSCAIHKGQSGLLLLQDGKSIGACAATKRRSQTQTVPPKCFLGIANCLWHF